MYLFLSVFILSTLIIINVNAYVQLSYLYILSLSILLCACVYVGLVCMGRIVSREGYSVDYGHNDRRVRLHAGLRRPRVGALHLLPSSESS